MKAVVLAAGLGQRLENLTDDKPKALVSVEGKPLLEHVLSFLQHEAITEIAVVGGYEFAKLESWINNNAPQVKLLRNTRYREGSIHTILAAQSFMDEDTLISNVDHIYPAIMLGKILENCRGLTAMCDFDRKLVADDMKIATDEQGNITRIHKKLTEYNGGYIGMSFIAQCCQDTYWSAAQQTLDTHGNSAVVEWILGEAIKSGQQVSVCDLSGMGWAEVDTREDLIQAEIFLQKRDCA